MDKQLFSSQPDTPPSPGRDSPAQRLAEHSARYLSDTELLSLLIRRYTGKADALDLAKQLLTSHGSLSSLSRLPVDELTRVEGIGKASAASICSAFALASRISREKFDERAALESPKEVADLMREEYRGLGQETFYLLLLNTKHRLIRRQVITVGLVDRSQIHAREVFRAAISANASRVILTHNHPSGDPTPSRQDIDCTKNLASAGKIIGIEVLDHVIIGARTESRPRDYFSLREEKMF